MIHLPLNTLQKKNQSINQSINYIIYSTQIEHERISTFCRNKSLSQCTWNVWNFPGCEISRSLHWCHILFARYTLATHWPSHLAEFLNTQKQTKLQRCLITLSSTANRLRFFFCSVNYWKLTAAVSWSHSMAQSNDDRIATNKISDKRLT